MHFFQVVQLLIEIESLVKEMQADGTMEKLETAFQSVASEASNPKVKDLFTKLQSFVHFKVAPPAHPGA